MTLRQSVLAWGALVVTILIWGSYLVSTRAAMTQNLGAFDVGFLRSFPAAIAMLPFILQRGLKPKGASWLDVAIIEDLKNRSASDVVFQFLLGAEF